MDQVRIGKFIAEMRKEQNYTQKALAERLGISDRTISKWECGKGMPEPSLMMPLCDILKINANELLSGSRLSENEYTKQAEENVISLMEEKGKIYRSRNLVTVAYIMGVLFLAALLFFSNSTDMKNLVYFIDFPTFVILLLFLVIFLPAAGLGKDFLKSFRYVYGKTEPMCAADLGRAVEAVKLAKRILLYGSIFVAIFFVMVILSSLNHPEELGPHLAVTIISVLYGMLGNLLLLPIQSYLQLAYIEWRDEERSFL